jgi:hypothetical protein
MYCMILPTAPSSGTESSKKTHNISVQCSADAQTLVSVGREGDRKGNVNLMMAAMGQNIQTRDDFIAELFLLVVTTRTASDTT